MPKLLHDTFKAWINKQPGADGALHVRGEAEVPIMGWSGTLAVAQPQGINDRILILDATLEEPAEGAGDKISHLTLTYDEAPAAKPYNQVTVRYEDDTVTVDVTEAQ